MLREYFKRYKILQRENQELIDKTNFKYCDVSIKQLVPSDMILSKDMIISIVTKKKHIKEHLYEITIQAILKPSYKLTFECDDNYRFTKIYLPGMCITKFS